MTPERLEELKSAFGDESRALGWYRCKEIVHELIAEVERLEKIREAFYDFYDPDDGISGPGGGYENIHRIFEDTP